MKTVLTSKPIGNIKSHPQRQLEGPKALVGNNWLIRNNSAHIKAILHPDLKKSRKPIENIPKDPSGKREEVYRKQCYSSNTCYCKEIPTRPTIFKRPNKCLSLEEYEQKLEQNSRLSSLLKSRGSLHCFCKGTHASASNIDLSDVNTLRKVQDELDEVNEHLAITDQRRDYEIYRDQQQEEYLKEIELYEEEFQGEYEFNHGNEDGDIQTLLGSKCLSKKTLDASHKSFKSSSSKHVDTDVDHKSFKSSGSKHIVTDIDHKSSKSSSSKHADTGPNGKGSRTCISTTLERPSTSIFSNSEDGSIETQEMREFRDDNYFETHDVDGYIGKDIPEHNCVHQFKLDDRLLPQAVTVDRYGRSRCGICGKPMDNKSYPEKPMFSEKVTREKIKNFSKCIELGLKPHDVNIGTSAKVELNFKLEDLMKYGKFIGNYYRRPCNTNTFALRQQKMAVHGNIKYLL